MGFWSLNPSQFYSNKDLVVVMMEVLITPRNQYITVSKTLTIVDSKMLGYAVTLMLEQYGDNDRYIDCVKYITVVNCFGSLKKTIISKTLMKEIIIKTLMKGKLNKCSSIPC